MSNAGLRQFDETSHITNSWLKDVTEDMNWEDRSTAYRAVRTTLHALRDHLPVESGAHLAAQLPLMLKGVFYDGWNPSHSRVSNRSAEAFLTPIADAFDRDPRSDARTVARSVFKVLASRISHGEIEHVRQALPKQIREIFAGV